MVGNKLKKIRLYQTKYSQQDIADYLGVDRNMLLHGKMVRLILNQNIYLK